jgi:hypothetical protein
LCALNAFTVEGTRMSLKTGYGSCGVTPAQHEMRKLSKVEPLLGNPTIPHHSTTRNCPLAGRLQVLALAITSVCLTIAYYARAPPTTLSSHFTEIISDGSCRSTKWHRFNVEFSRTLHPLKPGHYWGNLSRPYPTGVWFSNAMLGSGDSPIAPLPYAVRLLGGSSPAGLGGMLQVCYSSDYESESTIRDTPTALVRFPFIP